MKLAMLSLLLTSKDATISISERTITSFGINNHILMWLFFCAHPLSLTYELETMPMEIVGQKFYVTGLFDTEASKYKQCVAKDGH